MGIKKHIPNIITLLNLFCGLLAISTIISGYWDQAFMFVCLGIFFDFWDGFFARIWKVQSPIGLQLDSLADMVTSGVAPSLMIFFLLDKIQKDDTSQYFLTEDTWYMGFVPYIGFVIALASCYRLAKFNVDTRQTDSFIGLPTPANALLIMSIPMIKYNADIDWLIEALGNPFVLVFISFLSAYLLNAEIPLFSLKVKSFSWEKYKMQLVFLILSLILIVMLEFIAIPIIILLYVILSVINNTMLKKV